MRVRITSFGGDDIAAIVATNRLAALNIRYAALESDAASKGPVEADGA